MDLNDIDSIVGTLRCSGHSGVADRICYLREETEIDPSEPPINLQSLRQMATFLIDEAYPPRPRIELSPTGLIQIEWRDEENSIFAMNFLTDGQIQFAGIGKRADDGLPSDRVSGTGTRSDALRALGRIMPEITES